MRLFLFAFLVLIHSALLCQSSIRPENLKCEYLANPLGIDEPLPRLSWNLAATDSNAFNQQQTAYRIIVFSKTTGKPDTSWDSKWVRSRDMYQVIYNGKPLQSDQAYSWKVCVRDEKGIASWSNTASWTTGLFNHALWTAKWIGTGETLDPAAVDCNVSDPWFRKTIELTETPGRAVMFLASVGFHELYINGEKIGENVLSPCNSDFSKRARYVAYDISKHLKAGKNQIAIWLGASWSIFSSYVTTDKPRAPIVIAQADIYKESSDGESLLLRVQTDKSWKTHPSPNKLLGNWSFGHMGGEIWDDRQWIENWNQADYDEGGWLQAKEYTPRLMLTAQMVEANKPFREIHPVGMEELPGGVYRVDMGVNFAGWTELKLKGEPGKRIDLLFSEREANEITFQLHNALIPGSSGEAIFRNHFNYSSGRWITIKGLKSKPSLSDIKGWNIRTDYESAGNFVCSDSLQNWIYNTIKWTFENISVGGYIVDCSSRERLGYGDADAFAETGMFNYQLGALYTKWMEDWRDVQGTKAMDAGNYGGSADDGILPHTAPTYQGGGGPGWGGMCVMYPWLMYQHFGDQRILDKNFIPIKRWLAFLDTQTMPDNLMRRFGGPWDFLGDWLWPNATAEGMNNDKPQNICFNNCYRVYNLRTAAKIARLLGKTTEAQEWDQKANISAQAIHAKYYNRDDHSYADSSMGNLAAALFADIPPPELRDEVMKRLEKEILVIRKGHLHVGITAGALLFKVLREANRNDLIYSMTSQTEYPGWGYMKANGATSLWEMWEKNLPGHSLMHSSFLYPGAWYIDGLAGIKKDSNTAGFRHFIIRPPGKNPSQISWVNASFNSPAGLIKSAWKKQNGMLTLEVTIPPNTSALLYFPGNKLEKIPFSSGLLKRKETKDGCSLFELPSGHYIISGKVYQ